MADESFKAKLEKIIVELEKELREKNHSREELLIIQKRILNSLMEEEKKEKEKILEIGKIETTANSDIVELGKKWSRLAAVDDFVLNPKKNLTPELALEEKEETDELLLTPDPQLALKKKESEKIIQEIAPQIEVPNPKIQMIEAIKDPTVGIPSRDADKIVRFLTADFIDDRPTTAKAFIMWLEQDNQAVAAEEKRVEKQESIKQLLKKRDTHLGRDDSELSLLNSSSSLDRITEPKKELSGNLRPLIVKQSADAGGKTIHVDPEDPRVKDKPREPVPEYIENSGPELSEEQIAAKLAESEELMKQNIPIERQRGGKKRKITKKKKKSKKRKTKRRYKTGKRN
jgi:hypothetical protein